MGTDERPDLRRGGESKLILKDKTERIFGSVIVDTKVIEQITSHERGQMLKYLRITELKVGLILNFKNARLEYERVVR